MDNKENPNQEKIELLKQLKAAKNKLQNVNEEIKRLKKIKIVLRSPFIKKNR